MYLHTYLPFEFSLLQARHKSIYDDRTANARAFGREVESQAGQSYTVMQTVRRRFNIYASNCVALALL